MCALNIQKGDEAVWHNFGKFLENGGGGYLLKSNVFKQADETQLSVTVVGLSSPLISGWGNEKEPDCFCKLRVLGAEHLCGDDEVKQQTSVIMDDRCPQFNERFHFLLKRPNALSLLITLHDKDRLSSDGQY